MNSEVSGLSTRAGRNCTRVVYFIRVFCLYCVLVPTPACCSAGTGLFATVYLGFPQDQELLEARMCLVSEIGPLKDQATE